MAASHIMSMSKILADLCFPKQRIKTKNTFESVVCSVLVVKMCLQSIKKFVCSINGAQSARLEKETIDFKKSFKQIPETFKIYADFECNLKCVESYEGSYSKSIKITFLEVLLTRLFVLMINILSQ